MVIVHDGQIILEKPEFGLKRCFSYSRENYSRAVLIYMRGTLGVIDWQGLSTPYSAWCTDRKIIVFLSPSIHSISPPVRDLNLIL